MTKPIVESLSNRSVVLTLQELTEVLLPDAKTVGIQSEEDARLAVVALLATTGVAEIAPHDILPSEAASRSTGRRLLELLMADPETASAVREIVADPPDDEQMSVEQAITAAVVLGALITWLQTKVVFSLKRTNGKTDFEFTMAKAEVSPDVLRSVATTIGDLLDTNSESPPQA